MDEDVIKCCIAASLDCVEVVRDDDNLDSRGLLVRSPDGRAFRISVSRVGTGEAAAVRPA